MAEISALTPSPPGMGDPSLPPAPSSPHALPSLPTSESPKQALIPKSALYGDRATMGTLSSPTTSTEIPTRSPRASMLAGVSIPEAPPLSVTNETAVPQPAEGAVPPSEESRGPGSTEQAGSSEIPGVAGGASVDPGQKETAPSPDVNPSPNLYPSVHINPTSANPAPGESQPPSEPTAQTPHEVAAAAAPSSTSAPPPSSSSSSSALKDSDSTQSQTSASAPTAGAQAAAAPAAPSQALPPPPPPQNAKPRDATTPSNPYPAPGPKPASPATPGASKQALEPPGTPPWSEPPALVVQESGPMLPLPSSRQAPDTMSYLESASLMSGTLESLSGLGEDGSSVGSDSEINGLVMRRTDKYGFLGGAQHCEASEKELRVEVARQREMKWLDMFNHWDKWVIRRFQKVKLRCRKGIPSSLRAKAWQLLSNSKELLDSNPGKFDELEREPGDPKWLDIIEKDLHRQFPFHEMFAARGGHGQQDLYRILKAYTVYRPDEGYCQAQAPVAAVLLMHMPAEQAFWCLVQICERYLPGYYSAGLEAIQLDGEIFFSLLRRVCPMAYRHLKKFKIDPILYMTEWFMCVFSRTLPWSCVLRVWDMFFCEGVKVVFRVGLVLLKQMLGSVDKLRELQGMYETMERLRNIPPESIKEDLLIQEVITLPVTEALIERECSIQVRKWRESRGELTHQPARRLHGTRAIYDQKRRAASISSGGSLSFLGVGVPPPGPLRASSSLLSLPGFRRSKNPFHSQQKKGSLSGPSGMDTVSLHEFSTGGSAGGSPAHSGGRPQGKHGPSPLLVGASAQPASQVPSENQNLATLPPSGQNQQGTPSRALAPSPKVVAEQVTPTLPSPTANNAPLPPCPDPATKPASGAGGGAASGGEEDGKKKKRSKEEKKREKEEEKQKARERKEKEKAEKERQRKERERAEKERKKGGKKKDKAGGAGAEAEEKNGAAAARDLA
ncbi:TBC1 domain family member 10B-like [Alosa sapidissima]|uniref:TBC1 domain family member 10B-like n=1 Tax=Alosa sapidissima TaxID=34773 RepID=UPI001C09FD2A|nr:TBC1 domain family member 10B-like [Alosa sapidissima]XP_041942294.1 TBC1 domain family member 10B-like [Alosa sapidissima]XP_041942295.1 TBC1 domain family member 10B-like [Alosa sapidissima]